MTGFGTKRLIGACALWTMGAVGCGHPEVALDSDEGRHGSSRAALTSHEQAALDTAHNAASCTSLGSFYWEIGTGAGPLYGFSKGSGVTATTTMPLASASKWLYAAAYVQSKGYERLTADEKRQLNFTSGFIDEKLSLCNAEGTSVFNCYGPSFMDVSYRPLEEGRFFYNNGHMQRLALVDMPLRRGTGLASVTDWLNPLLGTTFPEADSDVAVAAGFTGSAAQYRVFLMKLINNEYALSAKLTVDAVPAWSGGPDVSYTPWGAGEAYYGLGHWIEGEGSGGAWTLTGHSSPGAFGFYPWVNATRTQYMLLARVRLLGRDDGEKSRACAQAVRAAYATGVAQL
ncbi:hypothetical protein [Corallococcus macrosporus]|uniref:Beta-lactamase-related domain-containing protein n=1 Tax=Myxococcus fulvus (strain ATCC BAA-855 / HW-1) TaxID=483219 RepID=F8CAQ6_MYXFH|nr:hypothetical protein [Corallococcus macrosporus]AEI67108.1 hypothetical protein LILAB_26075 [Corallococcus macrosporus]